MQTESLTLLIERLAGREWRDVAAAEAELVAAGERGLHAVLAGLADPRDPIRRACARFLDHHGSDAAVPALARALRDPVPKIRREAVHSLGCQRCKAAPLAWDIVPLLIERLERDENAAVRREAVYSILQQTPDERTRAALHRALEDTDPRVARSAHDALRLHDPEYRRRVDAEARARNIEKAPIPREPRSA